MPFLLCSYEQFAKQKPTQLSSTGLNPFPFPFPYTGSIRNKLLQLHILNWVNSLLLRTQKQKPTELSSTGLPSYSVLHRHFMRQKPTRLSLASIKTNWYLFMVKGNLWVRILRIPIWFGFFLFLRHIFEMKEIYMIRKKVTMLQELWWRSKKLENDSDRRFFWDRNAWPRIFAFSSKVMQCFVFYEPIYWKTDLQQ